MFVELQKMMGEGDELTIFVKALKNGRLSVTVMPKGDFTKQPALAGGQCFDGTASELDEELAGALTRYVTARKCLIDQVAAQEAVLAAASATVTADTAKALTKAQGAVSKGAQAAPKATVKVVPAMAAGDDGDAAAEAPATTDTAAGAREPAEVSLF